MLTNDTDRTAWYAEPYDDRLQHVLLHPAFEKDTHKRARPRPERHRNALGRRSRLVLVVALLLVAMFIATSTAHEQRQPAGNSATPESNATHLPDIAPDKRLDGVHRVG